MALLLTEGPDAAEVVLDAAEADSGGHPLLSVGRARVLSGRGDHEAALETLLRASERDPELAEAHYFLSLTYFNGFLGEESLDSAERAVALDADNVDYLYQAAQMYDRTGRMQQAEASWEKLLVLEPDEPRYLVPLAGLHDRMGDRARALELLDRAAATASEEEMGQMARQLAVQLRNEQQTSSELERINTALKFSPQDPRLHHQRAELLSGADDYIGAEAAVRNAISLEPEAAPHPALLSRILDSRGDKEGAAAAMESAVELDPDDVDNRLSLAGLWMQIGDIDRARQGLERVIEMAPDTDQADFASEQLLRIQGGG